MPRATVSLSACAIGAALAAGPARAQAPIVTDGTMGARAELNGPAMQIPNTLGTQAGKNLFHSFQRFNIPTRNSATFTGPGGIDNVVSRVTGGEASTIDGTFRSTIPGANVWFTNPAGVTFGPNASLDVPASFHASTANEIRFPDGGRFSADLGATSTLSVAPPEAFGFLSSNPAPLKVERSQLAVGTDATLSLAAGGIDIQGNTPIPDFNLPELIDINGGTLRAPSGTINLASVAGPAAVKSDGTVSGNNHGAIRLTDGALVNASGDGAGVVRIRGGELTATGSYIIASNTGSAAGAGGIDISADRFSLQGDGRSPSLVAANARNAGNAAPINVRAQDVALKDESDIKAVAYAAGKAGDIRIDAANQMTLDHIAAVNASSESLDLAGAGGEITVSAGNLAIRDQSQIVSLTRGRAPAGNIKVTAGTLLVDALAAGEPPRFRTGIVAPSHNLGRAGNISIRADEIRLTNGAEITSYTDGSGDAGTVIVHADNLTLNDASISVSSSGSGKAGDIRIDAANQMTLDNGSGIFANSFRGAAPGGGKITVHAGSLVIRGQSQINSFTRGRAPAGNINVTAGTLLADSALAPGEQPRFPTGIFSSAASGSSGDAGTVIIHAGNLTLNGPNTLISSAAESNSSGNAGTVRIEANNLTLKDARIRVSSFGSGKAGNIGIDVSSQMTLDNNGNVVASSLEDAASGGGEITVHAGSLLIRGPSEITSLTRGRAPAGNITVTAGTLLADSALPIGEQPRNNNPTGIFSSAESGSSGNAGTVIIHAGNLTLKNADIDSSSEGSGKAGNIQIDAPNQLILDNGSGVLASSLEDAAPGGGEITVSAGNLAIRDQSQIVSLTRGRAPAGNINVTAGTLLADSALAPGEQPRFPTGIFSSAASGSSGDAGTIIVDADNLILKDAKIDSSSGGSGRAGEIILTGVSKLFLSDGARVTTQSGSAGGGNIAISGAGTIVLRDDSRIGVDTVAGKQAGDITIDSRFLVLNRSKISADANAGSGGNIRIAPSTRLFRSPDSEITARGGPAGVAGTVLMNPETDVTVDVAQLPGAVMNTADQMHDRCAVRGLVEGSSFTIAGLETLSPTLEGYLPGTYARVANEDTAVTDGSLMVASGGGLAFPVWTVACAAAR